MTAAAAIAVVAGMVLVTIYLGDRTQPSVPGDMHFAGISCTEVRRSMPDMMAGKLAGARAEQIQDHLRQCQVCREMLEQREHPLSHTPAEFQRPEPGPSPSLLTYLEWSPPSR